MAGPTLRRTYEARSVSAAISHYEAIISFQTSEGEELVVAMDRQTLARLQHHLAHALAPVDDSSQQP